MNERARMESEGKISKNLGLDGGFYHDRVPSPLLREAFLTMNVLTAKYNIKLSKKGVPEERELAIAQE